MDGSPSAGANFFRTMRRILLFNKDSNVESFKFGRNRFDTISLLKTLIAFENKELKKRAETKPIIIVGSAPTAEKLHPRDFAGCICVNGSVAAANELGFSADITVINGWTIRHRKRSDRLASYKFRALAGRNSRTILLLRTSGVTSRKAQKILQSENLKFEKLRSISSSQRDSIIEAIAGDVRPSFQGEGQVSTGVLTLAVILWLGFDSVVLFGFSLSDGSSILPPKIQPGDSSQLGIRQHTEADAWFLSKVAEQFPQVTAVADEYFHEQTGIPKSKISR